jgi:superfamily II DNA/RNA helicase
MMTQNPNSRRRTLKNGPSKSNNCRHLLCVSILALSAANGFAPSFRGQRSQTERYSSSPLETKTVPELKQLLKESGFNERGLLTRLKRKQDLIEYLEQHQRAEGSDDVDNLSGIEWEQKDNKGMNDFETEETILASEIKDDNEEEILSQNVEVEEGESLLEITSEIASFIPASLQSRMVKRGIDSLLPSQVASFQRIYAGGDAVLQAPTGSGKTLAYVLPLVSRKFVRSRPQKVCMPVIITIAPSRELARQVGKEWSKFTDLPVATVFGGVPIERHVSLLKSKPVILVSTPGRLRELVREGHLDYSQVTTLVLDEADTLLDQGDSPDVRAIFDEIETAVGYREKAEYQLVLVSATINANVKEFTDELMMSHKAYIRVKGSESKVLVSTSKGATSSGDASLKTNVPAVQHWHMSCKSSKQSSITADLISILSPRLTIVFVSTKSETETVASFLSSKLMLGDVRILHGDMTQTSRSRSIALIREAASLGTAQVLVATDVASRGLDLPNVDLVVQFGVPRVAGQDGTFSSELYTHRSGRTGRVRTLNHGGSIATANAITMYDPANGEGKIIPELVKEIEEKLQVQILPKLIPSPAEVVEAGYKRTKLAIGVDADADADTVQKKELATYFKSRLQEENNIDTSDPEQLLEYLSKAMAALSSLDASASPFEQQYSLLTGDDSDRTLRLSRKDRVALSPPQVTQFCKPLGSGKLGRVVIAKDGSAIFDLPLKRANRLLAAIVTETSKEFDLKQPLTLPVM